MMCFMNEFRDGYFKTDDNNDFRGPWVSLARNSMLTREVGLEIVCPESSPTCECLEKNSTKTTVL
jgi:hypothetical protein